MRWVEFQAEGVGVSGYPFGVPAVAALRDRGGLDLDPGVTVLCGDNGTGKSTLVEALAVAAGFNPEGGSKNFRFATRASESDLGQHLRLTWAPRKPRTGFFLRAESFYNVATEVENLEEVDPGLIASSYGGRSPHERSHGESFLALAVHRFGPNGLYLLDEPESALSVHGCVALLARMHDLVAAGSQFILATHSPILLAYPGATIYQISREATLERVDYDDTEAVRLHRDFLADPGRYLYHLFAEE
ncbi:MAG: AAA family ATPase [Pseudonocardiales bacterium]|nr:AAA family ATPase [Pseudonocardiales bacterium]